MDGDTQRAVLARLIRDSGAEYAALSRLLGRNPAYIQQFIKRGVPRKLNEEDRKLLARYFGVGEHVLGGPAAGSNPAGAQNLIFVPRLDVEASAGHGRHLSAEPVVSHIAFNREWLRQLSLGAPADLSMIRVKGDSMSPTLSDGDDILVDLTDAAERLRDGIYVLRRDDTLMVKRVALSPSGRTISITSDNDVYAAWPQCELSSVNIIGRVVWISRRLR